MMRPTRARGWASVAALASIAVITFMVASLASAPPVVLCWPSYHNGSAVLKYRKPGGKALATDVLISEVGPRDGLQSVKSVMPTAQKCRWIDALAAAGLREIEVGSFVSPKALPQMADCAEVVAHALTIPGLQVAVLVPNLKYAQMAFEAGAHQISIPVSVSEPHLISNIRKNHQEIIADVREIVKLRNERYPGVEIEAGLATAFGCTIQGVVPEDDVIRMGAIMADCDVDTINLADTVGVGNPAQIKRLFPRLRAEVGDKCGGAHLHNTDRKS